MYVVDLEFILGMVSLTWQRDSEFMTGNEVGVNAEFILELLGMKWEWIMIWGWIIHNSS